MLKSLEAKITQINEGKATLEIEKQKIVIDIACLPEKSVAQKKLKLYFLDSDEAVTSEKKIAKNILEEILNGK